MRKLLSGVLALLLTAAFAGAAFAQSQGVPWQAVDALGRKVESTQPLRENKSVGIFYFLWIDSASAKAPWTDGPYDVAKILERLPEAEQKDSEASKSDLWAPMGQMHFWGEPLF
ncbi:MAG: hypothetical protein IKS14_04910, partial [Thermoguttaceae bacterium]|nr:hypothetical protein [Thermoguttaceae bacterium]